MSVIIGIDPGKTGAVAAIGGPVSADIEEPYGTLPCVVPIEEGVELLAALQHEDVTAFVERGMAIPGQGLASTYKFGLSGGRAIGWCEGLMIPYEMVSARDWQNALLRGEPRGDRKARKTASKRVAKRLFPDVDLTLGGFAVKDGASDAILIAEYGRRTMALVTAV